ncbi:AAA family ATPase [Gemella haemolysans]|uniref:AAA family ATPase n=1 Tax=Gemella haemolysans TaxID=1379 RepID=UPI00195863DB|nr:AAA family ATPase [Gemella haemolysans]VTX52245.1 AAA domain protein [Gemella haemolysans]
MEDVKPLKLKEVIQINNNDEIITSLLNKHEVMALVGSANSCKTSVVISLAISIINNGYWLDRFKVSGKKVLFVNTSSKFSYVVKTIEKLGRNEAVNENLEILDVRNESFNKIDELCNFINNASFEKYDLIIIDTIDTCTQLENQNYNSIPVKTTLSRLAFNLNTAIVFTHDNFTPRIGNIETDNQIKYTKLHLFCDVYIEFLELYPSDYYLDTIKCDEVIGYLKNTIPEILTTFKFDISKGLENEIIELKERINTLDFLEDYEKEKIIAEIDEQMKMVNRRKFYKLKIVSKENGSEDYFYYFYFPYLYNVTSEYIENLEVGKKAVDTLPKKDKRKTKDINKASNKKQIIESIQKFRQLEGEYPTSKDLQEYLGISKRTLQRKIKDCDGEIIKIDNTYTLIDDLY